MNKKGFKRSIKEFWAGSSLRQSALALGGTVYNKPLYSGNPIFDGTRINMSKTRELYQNLGNDNPYGDIFARPIIDLSTNFIGLPSVQSGDEYTDDLLEKCIEDYWAESLYEIYRNTLRDSETWVRVRLPFPGPLVSAEEEERIFLEIVDPDRIHAYYDPFTNILERVEIRHKLWIEEDGWTIENLQTNREPPGRIHDVIEVITKDHFQYFDITASAPIPNLDQANTWGFIPLVQVYNEYDSTMKGGQSDLEVVYPFLKAYNDVVKQTMNSHSYHSTPKVYMNLNDIGPFLAHNFPGSFDEDTGQFTGEIKWSGKEIFFMESEEKIGFLEAQSVLGDSVSLLEFLIDCICIASETPEWAFMRIKGSTSSGNITPQTLPFVNKINRKRVNFEPMVQQLAKMALAIYGLEPVKVGVTWRDVQIEDATAKADAMNRVITGLEVANRAGVVSKITYRNTLKPWLPFMDENDAEQMQIDKEIQADLDQQVLEAEKLAAVQVKVSASTVISGKEGTPAPAGGPNSVSSRSSRVSMDVSSQGD